MGKMGQTNHEAMWKGRPVKVNDAATQPAGKSLTLGGGEENSVRKTQ